VGGFAWPPTCPAARHGPDAGAVVSPDPPARSAARDLSVEQREQLRRLLERELVTAWRSTLAAGADPAAMAGAVDSRVEALRSWAGLVDDAEHLPDDPSGGSGIAEQG